MNIKKRKLLIYGINRHQEDFEYLFPKSKIIGYIIDKNLNEFKGKPCYNINDLNVNKLKKYTVIICDRKSKKIDNIFSKLNFKNVIYLENLAYLLDDKIDEFTMKLKLINSSFQWNCEKYKKNSEYFKEMIYTDSIDNIRCDYPFRYAHVQPGGFVYSCCPGWSKGDIGSILFKSVKKVWNSNSAKLHRLAIINKTYIFCNPDSCPFMSVGSKKTNTRFSDLETLETPNEVCISIDRSCNLKCPSCRNDFCSYKGSKLKIAQILSKRLTSSNWTTKPHDLVIASQGEVFFSNIYKNMIFNSKITKRDFITIHTNGTLLTKKNLDKLCSIYNKINFFISIDAVTKETYEKVRVGGNFEQLMKNLEYLSKIKKETDKISLVEVFFVVQKNNYNEMIDFVKLMKKLDFDKITFSRIENWETYTDEEFKEVSMFDENDNPKKELQKILKDPIFDDEIVTKNSNVIKNNKTLK